MDREEIIAKLKEAEPKLRASGVAALYLFGSYVGAGADPDEAVFIDPKAASSFDFQKYADVTETIRKLIGEGVEIGYSTRDGLSLYIRANVEAEAIRVF
jgi:predicted nucleotidyltransferase